jgi:hypothetical protein
MVCIVNIEEDAEELERVTTYNRKFVALVQREQNYMQGLVLLMNVCSVHRARA